MKKDIHGLTIRDYLLGDSSVQMWWAMMILAIIMAAVMMWQRVKKRDLTSERTPEKWDWKWFIADNLGRSLSTVFSIFLFTRLALIWVQPQYVIVASILIGLISDQLPVIFGFIKEQVITKVKTQVVKIFGGGKVETTTTETTVIEPVKKD